MPLLRAVVLPGLGVIVALAAAGRAMRLLGGDDPPEDRAVRALQRAFGHRTDDGDAAAVADLVESGSREWIDRVTEPLSWYSGVPQTIANGAIWCAVTWLWTRDRRSAVAPAAALAIETACFVASAALVGRPRPAGVWRPEPPHATSSFPSGHTAAAFALHGALADLLDRDGTRWRAAPRPAPSIRDSRSNRFFAGLPRPAPHLRHRRGRHAGTVERLCGAARADVLGGRAAPPGARLSYGLAPTRRRPTRERITPAISQRTLTSAAELRGGRTQAAPASRSYAPLGTGSCLGSARDRR